MTVSNNKDYYIICEDLFKIYKVADLEVVALRGLDLRIRRGEFMAIVGASGSGKSTLLNILGGLDTPSAGKVIVGRRDLLNMKTTDLVEYRRQDVGFVWQQVGRNLIPYLTALQNVEMPLILLGWPQKKRRRQAEDMLAAVGLADRMQHRPDRLSGGEQQRVAVAVALAHNPPLLLADEPTGELDSQTAEATFDMFNSINEKLGITIVIVTHDIHVLRKVRRVVTIRDGRASLEAFLVPSQAGEQFEEYVIVDKAGRLQLPQEHMDKLEMKDRVKMLSGEDHIMIWPGKIQENDR